MEEDSQTNIEDIGVAFVAGVEVELVESFEVVTEVEVEFEVELVESFEIVTEVEVELVESSEIVTEVEIELVESFEVVTEVVVDVELVERFEVVTDVVVDVELVESFEVETETVVVVVAGPKEQHNYCWLPALDFWDQSGYHRNTLGHWGKQAPDACLG